MIFPSVQLRGRHSATNVVMSALHTACEREVKFRRIDTDLMQGTLERISVREKDARSWKERRVEVAENSPAASARASPPLRCGDITADVPGRHAKSRNCTWWELSIYLYQVGLWPSNM